MWISEDELEAHKKDDADDDNEVDEGFDESTEQDEEDNEDGDEVKWIDGTSQCLRAWEFCFYLFKPWFFPLHFEYICLSALSKH